MASTRVIGLDIGSTAVRAVELEFAKGDRARSNPTVVRVGEQPLPQGAVRDGEVVQPETVSESLRTLWGRARFESKDVVLGVGNQRVLVRELDLPWLPTAQLKSSLSFQVNDLLPMSADEALLDYYPTGETQGDQGRMVQGMLVAAQRDTVTANVLAAEGAGLRPVMVDLNAFALLRAICRGDYARAVVAYVDQGATVTTVVIAVRGVPRLVRSLPTGGATVTGAVASALGVSFPEAEQIKRNLGVGLSAGGDAAPAVEAISTVVRGQVESIRNTFVYYAGLNPGQGIEVVVLTGGGAQLPGFGQYLSSASRLPTTLGDPLAGLRPAKTAQLDALRGHESSFALPVGLAYGVAA
ncbi:type IV pilus assembly protein PilM [Cellulomonas xiejunii]|uniref:Pilus assembly protein PilM n=1 Tax=Cellulomonas xiejunii TaxID=2968083 RepID=A0ABY5KSX0_9CELL|nr:type IV pilus assembly protein PilM [Cellulomonas xiejunii]MCC2314819.1 pilus assembly protein PilM [Cellulomonas xiejunii]MCC2323101.1 pilus assembly protein PilM [Cellulomonas xiejunii]UUI73591.1 pilus assembly protein PilM [Cellulomonas xiejunii]